MSNILATTFIYNEKGKDWINITDCRRIGVIDRKTLINKIAICMGKSNDFAERCLDPDTKYGIFFLYPSMDNYHFIDGFKGGQEATNYLQDMLEDTAIALGVPDGQ